MPFGVPETPFGVSETPFGFSETPFGVPETPFGVPETPFCVPETLLPCFGQILPFSLHQGNSSEEENQKVPKKEVMSIFLRVDFSKCCQISNINGAVEYKISNFKGAVK